MNNPSRKTIDLVIPIYNEEKVLPHLAERLDLFFQSQPSYSFRVFFVNDGSRDGSLPFLKTLAMKDPRYNVIELTRNFGHQAALSAGLAACSSDAVVFLDADLQDPPEKIADMLVSWESGGEIIRAERVSRSEHGIRKLGFNVFHRFFNHFSDYPIPANTGTFSLLNRTAYEALRKLPEKHRFLPGLCAWIGFDQRAVSYHREDRVAGKPKQTLRRLFHYALDALFSFSYVPLRLMFYAGLMICLLGFSVGIYFISKRLLGVEDAFTGFTTLIVTMLALGGFQLMGLGIIGEYIARIYDEAKGRPYYMVRHPQPASEEETGSTKTN